MWDDLTGSAAARRGVRVGAATAPWWCTLPEIYVLEFIHMRHGTVGLYVNRTDVGHCWKDVILAWEGACVRPTPLLVMCAVAGLNVDPFQHSPCARERGRTGCVDACTATHGVSML